MSLILDNMYSKQYTVYTILYFIIYITIKI